MVINILPDHLMVLAVLRSVAVCSEKPVHYVYVMV